MIFFDNEQILLQRQASACSSVPISLQGKTFVVDISRGSLLASTSQFSCAQPTNDSENRISSPRNVHLETATSQIYPVKNSIVSIDSRGRFLPVQLDRLISHETSLRVIDLPSSTLSMPFITNILPEGLACFGYFEFISSEVSPSGLYDPIIVRSARNYFNCRCVHPIEMWASTLFLAENASFWLKVVHVSF